MREEKIGYSLSPFFNLYAGGTKLEIKTILDLIEKENIGAFVEIGVYEGGLAERIILNTPCIYFGIDLNEYIVDERIKAMCNKGFGRLEFCNCMSVYARACVGGFINNCKYPAIVYCDNGNKKEEIKFYHNELRSGDILLTHDFWDERWPIVDYPDYAYREVTPQDVKFLDDDPRFTRLPDFVGTRLVGWKRS